MRDVLVALSIGALIVGVMCLSNVNFDSKPVYANTTPSITPIPSKPAPRVHKSPTRRSQDRALTAFAVAKTGSPEEPNAISLLESGAVRPGFDRSQVREVLGDPTLEATTMDRGSLFETYVYHRGLEEPMVLAHMKNGVVEDVVRR